MSWADNKIKKHTIELLCTVRSLENEKGKWHWSRTTVSALQRHGTAWQLVSDSSKDSRGFQCVGGYKVASKRIKRLAAFVNDK